MGSLAKRAVQVWKEHGPGVGCHIHRALFPRCSAETQFLPRPVTCHILLRGRGQRHKAKASKHVPKLCSLCTHRRLCHLDFFQKQILTPLIISARPSGREGRTCLEISYELCIGTNHKGSRKSVLGTPTRESFHSAMDILKVSLCEVSYHGLCWCGAEYESRVQKDLAEDSRNRNSKCVQPGVSSWNLSLI